MAEKPDFEIQLSVLAGLSVPNLPDYFGVWAMQEEVFRGAALNASRLDLRAHVLEHQTPAAIAAASARAQAGFDMAPGGIAIIQVTGTLMKSVGSMTAGTSTIAVRRQIRQAAQSEEVNGILLIADSPGGTVAGTQELADDVGAATKQKPVFVQVADLAASAMYWVSSQASFIAANRTALIGSIGTLMVVNDLSGAAAMEGVKVHVMRTGVRKGAGVPGTEITADQLGKWQAMVEQLNEHFLAGVASGRRMSLDKVRELATGDVFIADQARTAGLIDAVQSLDQTLAQLRQKTNSSKGSRMSTEAAATAPVAEVKTLELRTANFKAAEASYQDLVAAFPKADEKFICAQLAKKATLDEARAAHAEHLQAQLDAQAKEITELKAGKGKTPVGVKALETKAADATAEAAGDSAREQFNSLVDAKVKAGTPRQRAVSAVVAANPDLHARMLDEANQGRKRAA